MSEHENAPAAPPEGEADAILRRKDVRQPCAGKRGDGPWVLAEPAIYLSVTERDTVLAALAAATARADRAERLYQEAKAIVAQSELAERLAQAEAERLRGVNALLEGELTRWRLSRADAARRVEAMREACARKAADSVEQDADRLWDAVMSTELPELGGSQQGAPPGGQERAERAVAVGSVPMTRGGRDAR